MDYSNIITIEPDKRGGKPCVRGLRITVYDILDYLAGGMSEQEILADFPDLRRDDILACLAFAADRERRSWAPGRKTAFLEIHWNRNSEKALARWRLRRISSPSAWKFRHSPQPGRPLT